MPVVGIYLVSSCVMAVTYWPQVLPGTIWYFIAVRRFMEYRELLDVTGRCRVSRVHVWCCQVILGDAGWCTVLTLVDASRYVMLRIVLLC